MRRDSRKPWGIANRAKTHWVYIALECSSLVYHNLISPLLRYPWLSLHQVRSLCVPTLPKHAPRPSESRDETSKAHLPNAQRDRGWNWCRRKVPATSTRDAPDSQEKGQAWIRSMGWCKKIGKHHWHHHVLTISSPPSSTWPFPVLPHPYTRGNLEDLEAGLDDSTWWEFMLGRC